MNGSYHGNGDAIGNADDCVGCLAEKGSKKSAAVVDHSSNTEKRLDAAWADAEREVAARGASPLMERSTESKSSAGRKEPSLEHNISPLMAHPSDATLQTSNRTSLLAGIEMADKSKSTISKRVDPSTQQPTEMTPRCKKSLLEKYRSFLQKHEPSLDLFEHIMERFVFYGYLFKHDHRGISIEMYYAAWNIIRWMNDVVLVGWGEGMGMTIGSREEWLPAQQLEASSDSQSRKIRSFTESVVWRLNSVVPMLRAILTATTCIYPAMEAWSRRSLQSHPSYGTPLYLYNDDMQQQNLEEYQLFGTTSDLSPQKRRLEWEGRQCRAAQVSYRLERVRFLARLALLSISWWAQQRRNRCSSEHEGKSKQNTRDNEKEGLTLPSLLRRGGELDPYEQLIHLKDAEDEAKVVQYVGKRTGRRSIARSSSQPSSPLHFQTAGSPHNSEKSPFVNWLSGLLSSKNRIMYVYAVGELLHILRPLYWSHAENRQWQRKTSSGRYPPKQQRSGTFISHNFAIWKAWWISLLMDLISDKLLRVSQDGDSSMASTNALSHQRRGSLLGRGGGRHNMSSPSPSAEQAKLEELEWRRSRHGLYLLRSPMYNAVTRPLATLMGKFVSVIPSFGLARWAAEYVLDMMSYWNNNRFMLES